MKFSDILVTIENGKYKGENKYLHTVERTIPIYGQAIKQFEFDEGMFSIFDN